MGKGLNNQISAMVHAMDTLHMKGKLLLYLFWNTIYGSLQSLMPRLKLLC
jgi:hypothetical protein